MELSNEEIVDGIVTNNRLVLNEVYQHYLPMIIQQLKLKGSSRDEAMDVFQEGLVVLYEKLKTTNKPKDINCAAYLRTVCKNEHPINSYLAFSDDSTMEDDGNLYLWELKNLDLNSKMTVLSACNTGYGKLQEGEGLMSLGRAFIEAGSKSVVMSSWPAQDYATQKIMHGFYENLHEGLKKDKALRLAKLKYLEEADENLSHPFYWAGFFVNGLNDPINNGFYLPAGGIISIILLLILLIFIRIKLKDN